MIVPESQHSDDERELGIDHPHDLSNKIAADKADLQAKTTQSLPPAKPTNLITKPPVTVPNHELVRCLGAGGFGQVWLARHTLTEHYRACKLIPADKAVELEGLRNLKQRVPAHNNLFPIEEIGTVGHWLYCLMPLADSASTDQEASDHSTYESLTLGVYFTRRGRRSAKEASAIGVEIAEAVKHLHAHGVMHGDIKPENIMRFNGHWTLADYGLTRVFAAPSDGGYTPGYAPPEGAGSPRADQFATGVVLMELLTNWPARMLTKFRVSPTEQLKLGKFGPRLYKVIVRTTAEDPDNRYGSIDELIEVLRSIASSDTAPVMRRWHWSLVVSVILTAVVVAGWALLTANPQDGKMKVLAAEAQPEVNSFEVVRYRYAAERNKTDPLGPISADNPVAVAEDDVTVHVTLSSPAYCYLLSLDTNGVVTLRVPGSTSDPAMHVETIDYPSRPTGPTDSTYGLTDGPGIQGFMLLVSIEPLPSWDEWIAVNGMPRWEPDTASITSAIIYDGKQLRRIGRTRGEIRPIRGELNLAPIDWALGCPDIEITRLIAFPVLPD